MMRRRLISFIYFSLLGGAAALWCSVHYLTADAALTLYIIGAFPYGAFALIAGLIRRKRKLPASGRFSLSFIWFGLQVAALTDLYRAWYLTESGLLFLHAIGAAVYGLVMLIAWAVRRRKKPATAAPVPQKPIQKKNPPPALPRKRLIRRRNRLFLGAGLSCAAVAVIALWWSASRKPDAPETIVAFVQRYPEAASFSENYASEYDMAHDMNVAAECAEGVIPLFIQWDERWGYEDYGGNYLGINGCGPTCMSMVVCALTGDTRWNPYEMAQFADDEGYYYPGSGTSWSFMTEGAREFGIHAEEGEITREYILNNLSENTPMIVSMRPGDFTDGGHYIVLTGIGENGNILVNDPNSPEKSLKSWAIDRLLPQIKGIWRYWA